MLAQIQIPKEYNQIEIVIGMIICFGLMVAYDRFFRKISIQKGVELTVEMLEIIAATPIEGITVKKRVQKLQHDLTDTLGCDDKINIQQTLIDLIESNKKIASSNEALKGITEALKVDINKFYKEQAERQETLNKQILKHVINQNPK